jgi:hypothetical protein
MAVIKSKLPSVTVPELLARVKGKYFTLQQLGVPAESRVRLGIELAAAGHNKVFMKMDGRPGWVWLSQPGATDAVNAEIRAQFGGVWPG